MCREIISIDSLVSINDLVKDCFNTSTTFIILYLCRKYFIYYIDIIKYVLGKTQMMLKMCFVMDVRGHGAFLEEEKR